MEYLPLHFQLKDQVVLLVGGGEIARRKAVLLRKAGAVLRVVSPHLDAGFAEQFSAQCQHIAEQYAAHHLSGSILVIAATDNESVNRQVSADARALGIPVNVVDTPLLSTVIFPAIVDRSPVIISVGTGGGSPVLTRYIRIMLEALIDDGYARLARFLADRRDALKQRYTDIDERRRVGEQFLDSPGASLARQGKDVEAEQYLTLDPSTLVGEVALVGAGPGDPDLLTLKALQWLQRAEVILYDNLVSDAVLDRARRDATLEFVGKRSGYRSTHQEDINDLLVRLAKEGRRVVRLKGGDPFIFGRGGEEMASLIEHKIPFEVIPGITAASGCAAYAGIPLTHRDHAQSVRFVTGHPVNGKVDLPWEDYARAGQTLVFYMGLAGLTSICSNLMKHGMNPETPVAIVSRGTTPDQKLGIGTLESAPGLAGRLQLQSPTLTIIGDVVSRSPNFR